MLEVVQHRYQFPTWLAIVVSMLATPCSAAAQSAETTSYVIVFDTYLSPTAGAHNLLTLQSLTASLEDRFLPRKIGEERRRATLALGILYRSAKFMALDMPQDHLLMVAAHEVFGHGARFRELGEGRIRYGFDSPIPYGSGDAFTRFSGQFPRTPLASLAVSASGIEAQHAVADAIADTAVMRGRLHYREAWLYFESRVTGMTYILSASPRSRPGHDVADFLDTFEKACTAPCRPLSRRYVQRRALLAMADPLLYYAIYGFAGSYIGNGQTTGPLPMIPIGGGARVLPSLGFALTPHGSEWTARTLIHPGQRDEGRAHRVRGVGIRPGVALTSVAVRVGSTGARTTWGINARASDVVRLFAWPVNVSVDVWRQPPVLGDQTSEPLKTGAAATATVVLPLPALLQTNWTRGIHIAAGYKREGYIPGEQLSGGGFLRVGLRLR
jgi:hypothetical protein